MLDITIDTDISKLNVPFIHNFISNSYWAKDRTIDEMKTCINNSLNFGVFLKNKQIGYARIVTDYVQFAYIMDVFIDENFRNKGYSKKLIEFILNSDALRNVKTWRLATADAHKLYEKFGFKLIAKPENMMEKFV